MKQLNNRSHVQECSEQVHRILAEYCNHCYPNVPVSIDRAAFTQTFYRSLSISPTDERSKSLYFESPLFLTFVFPKNSQKKKHIHNYGAMSTFYAAGWEGESLWLSRVCFTFYPDKMMLKIATSFLQDLRRVVCISSQVLPNPHTREKMTWV